MKFVSLISYPAIARLRGEATRTNAANLLRACPRTLTCAAAVLCLLSGCYFAFTIVPAALSEHAPTVQQGLFPEWLGAREILHGRSPYRQEVTDRIQTAVYGTTLPAGQTNQQRYAYPVYFALLFLPLAIVPFSVAQLFCFAGCLGLTILSIRLWAPGRDFQCSTLLIFTLGTLSSYPAILGLQLCQPTLVIAGLLSMVVYWTRTGRLVWAGILAGLCTAKPQLAIAVLLPLSIWSLRDWPARGKFVRSLACSTCVLLAASEVAIPGWVGQWLTTLRAYSQYAGSEPLLSGLFHGHFFWPATTLLVVAVIWISYRFCETDLLFVISFSIAAFQLIFPFLLYNEILLVPAVLWLVRSPAAAKAHGQLFELLWSCSWVLLAAAAAATAALTVSNLIVPSSGLKLWQLPFVVVWLYPWSVLMALAAYAFANGTVRRAARA